jgi:SEC-C motif-containing protein
VTPRACPCGRTGDRGRPLDFAQCCGRYLPPSQAAAPDAQALMRSRYCAYVLGHEDYLLATWHPSTRPDEARFEPGTRWLGLQVRAHRQVDPAHAEVEFVARYRAGGRGHRLHECSRFVHEAGRWYYVDGDMRE